MIRVVLDTNVIVSATLSPHGTCAQLLARCLTPPITLVVSAELIAEYRRVLGSAHMRDELGLSEAEIEALLDALRSESTLVTIRELISYVPADPTDDKIVATAVDGGADFIASGDRHLLALGSAGSATVLKPAALLQHFETQLSSR